jgi:hypothetical protein
LYELDELDVLDESDLLDEVDVLKVLKAEFPPRLAM